MGKRKNKLVKIIVSVVIVLAIGGFALNWFLTHRLEGILRKELSQRVSKATDGFYQLDFDKLSVGLFNGELTIHGVTFKPDSAVFNQWAARDSLPTTYFDVAIGTIHFKGINLTWRFSYRELDFELFEVKTPFINIYDSDNSGRVEQKSKNTVSKTPYELISEYITVLTVKEINLDNATINYVAGIEDNSSLYSLSNVSCHTYGFRLDENSYESGKLLYSDDFDFTTNQPQILLSNNQFILNTDAIRLSTKDSVIQVNKIELIPQRMLWAQTNRFPDSYLEANVDSVVVRGVRFKREDALNYLDSRTFDIIGSDIKYFNTKKDTTQNRSIRKNKRIVLEQTVDLSWSLYSILSPLFRSISVDDIGIKEAKLAYSIQSGDNMDLYKMASFNFDAYNFKVDSLADIQRKFLYSDGFKIDAANIDGTIATKNHIFSIGEMSLNTVDGDFNLKNIRLWPITTKTDMDYTQGSIDSISIRSLAYDKGIRAEEFTIDAPVVEYVKMPAKRRHYVRAERTDTIMEGTTPLDFITPFFGFLSVGKINLNNGNLIFEDRRNINDIMVYKLPKIDFYATNVLANEQTINNTDTYVTYDDFKFRFENFDNFLPGKEYRLKVRYGLYTGWGGNLSLRDIRLIPQEHSWRQAPDTYLSLTVPSIDVKKLIFDNVDGVNTLKSDLIDIVSPQIKIIKTGNTRPKESKRFSQSGKFAINLRKININQTDIDYKDLTNKDSLDFAANNFLVNSFIWNSGEKLSIDLIDLKAPVIQIKKHGENTDKPSNGISPNRDALAENVHIGKIDVSDLKFRLDQPSMKVKTDVSLVNINSINKDKSSVDFGSIIVVKPFITVNQYIESDKISKTGESQSHSDGVYSSLRSFTENLSIGKFDIQDAQIDYTNTLNGKSFKQQQINSTNLDFTGLIINTEKESLDVVDFNFSTKNFHFPLNNGFYTLQIGEVDIHKKDEKLKISDLHLVPAYPKEEFAYHHPNHKDWFDVSVGNIALSGIDYPTYFADKILNIKDARVDDVKLLNFKNQKIEIQHNIMPMIYEGLQKAPVKLNIGNVDVNNFMVQYEELPKKGDIASKIFFTEMNGKFEGFTNIVTKPQQYIKLDADGKLMGTGYFTATWYLPVDSLNDRFLLAGKINRFDLTELNQLITPMAPAKVNSGIVNSLVFKTEASSKDAWVQMRFLYNGLNISVLKDTEDGTVPNKLYTSLVNAVLKKDNPDKRKKKPREPYLYVVRDPYHSTFNYLWQILQPPVVESVGISQGKQTFFKGVSNVISKIKGFFSGKKKPKSERKNQE